MTVVPKALVFGSSGMIGAAIANAFHRDCIDVVGFGSRPVADIKSEATFRYVQVDRTMEAMKRAMRAEAPFDRIVWAHGVNGNDSVYAFDAGAMLAMFQTNVLYIAETLHILLSEGLVRPASRFCVVSSIWQTIARQDKLSYSVSKAALQGLIASAAVDLARDNHLINAILPGVLDTEMTRAMLSADQMQRVQDATLFHRLPEMSDVVSAALFFCSDQNRSVTGHFSPSIWDFAMFASFDVKADARAYTITVDPGAAMGFLRRQTGDVLVICDEIFRERFMDPPYPVMSFPAEETHKTLEEAARLIEAARASGLTRRGKIIAVGGGIVQDVACFVASTYMRGIAWDYLPTTILGMVDSCIGGKSSINVGRFKNLAGTMHPPSVVLIDPDFAQTLLMEHRAGGLCEAAKITFARGGDTFERYAALDAHPDMPGSALAEVVVLSLEAKKWFIEVDEFDRKERLTLNFGHTFGHALESASGFAINHGAAVGLGMLCALDFAYANDLTRPSARLDALEADTMRLLGAVPELAQQLAQVFMPDFEQALLSDKKHTAERLTLVLPVAGDDGLPLSLCTFPRGPEILGRLSKAVERTQRKIVG